MNILSKEEHAEKLAKIQNFVDNWKAKHGNTDLLDGHSVYLLRTEDRDGNITGEAFALNVTTWRYYRSWFGPSSGQPYSSYIIQYLYIGDGTHDEYGDFPTTRSSMFHQTYSGACTRTSDDQTRIESGTIYYDQDTGISRSQAWVYTGYFDYVLSGISSDLTVTEIGLSSYGSPSELATHAYVMDSEGNYTSFVKHVNEKLTIEAYITLYHKYGYIENKLWNQGIGFAWNPWGYFTFGYSGRGYNWNSHYNGTINYMTHAYISSPRWYRSYNSTSYSDESSYRAGSICGSYHDVAWMDSNDPDTQIGTRSWGHSGNNSLIENKGYYYDLLYMTGFNSYGSPSTNSFYYASQMGIIREMRLPEPEEIVTNYAYTGTINNDDLSANFGHYQNASYDTRGLLPVVDLNVSSVKTYNGLTKEWDIDETVLNGTNTTNLTMNQLYPICGSYMYTPYLDTNVIRWGRQFVRIYPNMYTSYPITKISTTNMASANIWCSDEYWNPYSWERVEDPNNVPASQGAKRYFMGFSGEITGNGGPNTSTRPVEVTRTGYTKPTLVSEDTKRIDNIDTFNNGYTGCYHNGANCLMNSTGFSHYRILSNDDLGYIWMRHHLYYPDDSDLSSPGQSWLIQTSQPSGNTREPFGTLRFMDPSGHRILQVFTANNVDQYPSMRLRKISVFEMHSATEVAEDPSKVAPDEYVIDMGETFLDNTYYYNYGSTAPLISSTETGYVVFGNPNDSRTHIVNMVGDAESNYEPYKFILKYPDTDEEIPTAACYAMKYTNRVMVRDTRQDTDVLIGFMLIDLSTNTIVDSFTIGRTEWGGTFQWGAGWHDYFYMFGRTNDSSWDSSTTWKCRIYDGTRPAGSRIVDPEWGSEVCRCFIPGFHHWNWTRFNWIKSLMGTVQGDEECICFGRGNLNNNNDAVLLYYISLERPLEPFSFNNVGITQRMFGYIQTDDIAFFDVFKTPDGKNRLLIYHMDYDQWYDGNSWINYQYKIWVFDANLLRDMRKGPGRINSNPTSIPAFVTNKNNKLYTRWRYTGMYKGRILISEYDNTYYSAGSYPTRYYINTNNYHRFVDPKRLLPHKMTGTTYTIQAYNNPKRVYGIQNVTLKVINSADIWDPSDMPT